MSKSITKMWIELSTTPESDWLPCAKICERAFQNYPFYKYTHPDPKKRAEFLQKYFEYLYRVVLKDGKGLLCVIKSEESDGRIKIIGGMANTLDWNEEAEKEVASWRAVDEEGWKRHEEYDEWEEENIFHKLDAIAKSLQTNLMHGVFQVVDDAYRGQGIGNRFVMKGVQMMNDMVVRRKRLAGEVNPKPPLAYCLCENERSRNFTKKCGFLEVAQLRSNIPSEHGADISYSWIFLLPPKDSSWIDVVRKTFSDTSKL